MSSQERTKIYVVEDDPGLAELLVEEIETEGFQVRHAISAEDAWEAIPEWAPDVVVTDMKLPGESGMVLIPKLKQMSNPPGILMITAFGTVSQAVEALKQGADDFLTKPLDIEHLLIAIQKVLKQRELQSEVNKLRADSEKDGVWHGMLGKSRVMRNLYQDIERVSQTDSAILILGASGTGKELVAKAIHEQSMRKNAPFVAVNCAGIPSELMESEFFGHAAGAFTGAKKARAGLFKEANGGTLFLDEIAEMPFSLQAKLLRVLQEGVMRPVGSDQEVSLNVRIIAATHQNIEERIERGDFREDLFFRLEAITLKVPKLCDRGDDIELLATHFLQAFCQKSDRRITISPAALDCLYGYSFPGNIRELQNAIERAAVFCEGEQIFPEHLPERIRKSQRTASEAITSGQEQADTELKPLSEIQHNYVEHVLEKTKGNKQKAAEILGITRRTLYRWLDD